MTDSIRVSRTGTRVEVNDAGESIILDLYNPGFLSSILDLLKEFEISAKGLSTCIKEARSESLDDISSIARQTTEGCEKLAAKIDEIIGADTCRKVFGPGTPGICELADFFGQIGEIIKKHGDGRAAKYREKYAKYDRKAE